MLAIPVLTNQGGAIGKSARPQMDLLSALANAGEPITRPFWGFVGLPWLLCRVTRGVLGSSSHADYCTTIAPDPLPHHFLKITETAATIMAKPTVVPLQGLT